MILEEIFETGTEHKEELRRQGQDMLLDILRHKIDKNPWFAIYDIDAWGLTIDKLPGLKELMDQHQEWYMISLLKSIKDTNSDDAVQMQLDRFRKMGIRWPDLDILQQSINAEAAIRESQSMHDGEAKSDDDYTVAQQAIDMFDRGIWPGISFMGKYGLTVGDLPEAGAIIKKNKKSIMSVLLLNIKYGRLRPTLDAVAELKAIGVNWQEFKIIIDSLQAEAIDEADEKPTDPKLLRAFFTIEQRIEDDDYRYISGWLAEIGAHPDPLPRDLQVDLDPNEVIPDMLYSIKHHDDDMEVNMDEDDLLNMITGARKLGAKWQELDIMERSLRFKPSKESQTAQQSTVAESYTPVSVLLEDLWWALENKDMNQALMVLSEIGEEPHGLDEYWARIDRYEEDLIRALLVMIKHQSDMIWTVPKILSALRDMGAEWSDLSIIERSIAAGIK